MSLDDIKEPQSIRKAITEFRQLGRAEFLRKYGFGVARDYFLIDGRDRFDSKAIAGAAHGYEFPDKGPLLAEQFSGGEQTVARKLRNLGFLVEPLPSSNNEEPASALLTPFSIYTRAALKELLGTNDSTINNGVFRPKGFSSVFIFVTRNKTADRTQYRDHLDGDTLHWQGQSSGRTDRIIVNHLQTGLELLVFFREHKTERPGGGFQYLGLFNYVSHSGGLPTDFILRRASSHFDQALETVQRSGDFDPTSIEDARKKTLAAIVRRQGQPAFRKALLAAYQGRCAVTGCEAPQALEAAHIFPYQGPLTNCVSNGLLLRADLHTLFDLGLFAIDEKTLTIIIAAAIRGTEYERLSGMPIRSPIAASDRPSIEALRLHREESGL